MTSAKKEYTIACRCVNCNGRQLENVPYGREVFDIYVVKRNQSPDKIINSLHYVENGNSIFFKCKYCGCETLEKEF